MQDLLALDSSHRMNTPGMPSDNWHWRFNWQQISTEQKKNFAEAIARTGRSAFKINVQSDIGA